MSTDAPAGAPAAAPGLGRRRLLLLVALTLVWGLNWPIMKLGVSGWPGAPEPFPPLSFRAASMWLGLPVLAAVVLALGHPLALPRREWRRVAVLTVPNMLVWHVLLIVALPHLSSGRSAILGYTMPVFAALWGLFVFGDRLPARAWAGVGAAALGVVLLLWHEVARLAGAPGWAALVLVAAAAWALGTHLLRRAALGVPLLTAVFWMTALTTLAMTLLAVALERAAWRWPPPHVAAAIVYNALGVFVFAQAAWLYLARTLPPVAASISVMLIPVLGLLSGAAMLGEVLHWQDLAAMLALVAAIALVLLRR